MTTLANNNIPYLLSFAKEKVFMFFLPLSTQQLCLPIFSLLFFLVYISEPIQWKQQQQQQNPS